MMAESETTVLRKKELGEAIGIWARTLGVLVLSAILCFDLIFRAVRYFASSYFPQYLDSLRGWSIANPSGPANPTVYYSVVTGSAGVALVLAAGVAFAVHWWSTKILKGRKGDSGAQV